MTVGVGPGARGRGQVLGLGGDSPPSPARAAAGHRGRGRQARPYRSTKGASKARRDQMRVELWTLRNLLPLSPGERERLSYLNTMALVNVCVRRARHRLAGDSPVLQPVPRDVDFLPAVPGFLVTLTPCGKLVHLSRNVTESLGLSAVELVTRGDGVDHLVHAADRWRVHRALGRAAPSSERSFLCRMPCSRSLGPAAAHRWIRVCGRYLPSQDSSEPGPGPLLFVGLCSPVEWEPRVSPWDHRPTAFYSRHAPDMSFLSVCESVVYHLGYSPLELTGRSWYSLLHPGDLQLSSAQHRRLLSSAGRGSVDVVCRLQHRDSGWSWVYTRAEPLSAAASIECSHLLVSECEALHLRQKLLPLDPPAPLRRSPQDPGLPEVPNPRSPSPRRPPPPAGGSPSPEGVPSPRGSFPRGSGANTPGVDPVPGSPPTALGWAGSGQLPPYSPQERAHINVLAQRIRRLAEGFRAGQGARGPEGQGQDVWSQEVQGQTWGQEAQSLQLKGQEVQGQTWGQEAQSLQLKGQEVQGQTWGLEVQCQAWGKEVQGQIWGEGVQCQLQGQEVQGQGWCQKVQSQAWGQEVQGQVQGEGVQGQEVQGQAWGQEVQGQGRGQEAYSTKAWCWEAWAEPAREVQGEGGGRREGWEGGGGGGEGWEGGGSAWQRAEPTQPQGGAPSPHRWAEPCPVGGAEGGAGSAPPSPPPSPRTLGVGAVGLLTAPHTGPGDLAQLILAELSGPEPAPQPWGDPGPAGGQRPHPHRPPDSPVRDWALELSMF